MRVESLRLEWIEALIDGDAVFTERFGIAVIEGWAGFPEALPHALDAARGHNADPWGSHLFFDDDGALVGFGGFKGPPTEGEVEIGYAIAPARQGRGLATTATRTLIDRARDRGATRVVAHTLATPNASTAVLVHCGFTRTATIADPDHGDVWRWELQPTDLNNDQTAPIGSGTDLPFRAALGTLGHRKATRSDSLGGWCRS